MPVYAAVNESRTAMTSPTDDTADTEAEATIADFLRHRRDDAGLSQQSLAEASGVSYGMISHVETGRRNLSYDKMLAVAAALGLDAEETEEFNQLRLERANRDGEAQPATDIVALIMQRLDDIDARIDALERRAGKKGAAPSPAAGRRK